MRRFNVAIQGAQALSNFDIYAQAGKASLITRSFPATVTNGTLTIAFSKVFDNAVVQALDIYPAASGVDLSAPVFAAIPEPENTTYTTPPAVTLSVNDDVNLNDGYWRIDDQDPQPAVSGSVSGDADCAILAVVLDGVCEQVEQDLAEALAIRPHYLLARRQ